MTGRLPSRRDEISFPLQNTEAMMTFYRALGLQVNEGPQICMVHLGDQKINFHQPALWQQESFDMRAPAARPPCGDFCFVWEGSPESLTALLDRVGAEVIAGPAPRLWAACRSRRVGLGRSSFSSRMQSTNHNCRRSRRRSTSTAGHSYLASW